MTTATKSSPSAKKLVYQKFPPHIYKTPEGTWRGFVALYDVAYEAKTRKEVEEVLPLLLAAYESDLVEFNYPSHLAQVPLSHKYDIEEFQKWMSKAIA